MKTKILKNESWKNAKKERDKEGDKKTQKGKREKEKGTKRNEREEEKQDKFAACFMDRTRTVMKLDI